MKIKRAILVFFLGVMLIPLTCVGGFAELNVGDYKLDGSITLGGGWLSPSPRFMNRSYLTQYVPFPEGFLAYTDLRLRSMDDLEYYRYFMYQPGLTDQDYWIQLGKLGVYHAEVEFDQMQHIYCRVNPNNNNIAIQIYRVRAGGWVSPTEDITLFVEDQFLRRTGSQAGSYVTGPGNPYNFFTYLSPIDYKQNDVKVGGEYDRPLGQFRLAYHHSNFDNGNQTLLGRPGVFNTIVSLPPSNVANYMTAEGAMNMPQYKTRITGSISYGWLSQNDTVYDRSYVDQGLAGLGATTLAAYLAGISRPIDQLALRYSYRAYNYENNNTANKVLQTAFGDNNNLLVAEQYSYLKQTVNLGATYKLNKIAALEFGYAWQGFNRTNGQGTSSTNTGNAGIRLFPTDWLNLICQYAYSTRRGSDYYALVTQPGEPTTVLVPFTYKFYTGSNTTNKVNFVAEATPVENVTCSVNCSFFSNVYSNSQYGLLTDGGWSTGADVSWRPTDRVALSLGYDHQYIRTKSSAVDSLTFLGEQALILGDAGYVLWTSDTYDTISLRGDFKVIPKKLDFSSKLNYSFSNSNFHNQVIPNLNESILYTSNFFTYTFNEHWACKVGYIFQYFNMTNAYQTMYTRGVNTSGTAGNQQPYNTLDGYYPNATAHLVQGFIQYRF
jgi:hypothetical protein